MHQLSIEVCNNRLEANARKEIIKSSTPDVNWMTRIIEDIGFVMPSLVPDLANEPHALTPVFTPETGLPSAPAVVLLIWTED